MRKLSFSIAFFAGIVAASAIYLIIFSQDLVHLDRLFLPDDTYYTLSISRNIARGLGPTTDGVIITSGFQPLITLFEIPVFWLTDEPLAPIRWAIAISIVFGLICIGLVGLVVSKSGGTAWSVFLAMLFTATTPIILGNSFNGLETTLGVAFALLTALLVSDTNHTTPNSRLIVLGLVCGLALLARIDNCFIVGIAGLVCLSRVGFTRTILVAATAAVVVAPWWGWCWAHFGMPIPESGKAVGQILEYYRVEFLDFKAAFLFGLLSLGEIANGKSATNYAMVVLLFGIGAISAIFVRSVRRRNIDAAVIFSLAAVTMTAFYVIKLPAYWFLDRYFLPMYLALIIAGALGLDRLVLHWRDRPLGLRFLPVAFALLLVVNTLPQLFRLHKAIDPTTWNNSVTGYAPAAIEIMSHLPDNAVVGAFQSGALGYFQERGIRVVNLDGVVSGAASRALANNQLADFMVENKVTHFSDWDSNRKSLLDHSGASDPETLLTPIAQIKPQLLAQFTLYQFNLP